MVLKLYQHEPGHFLERKGIKDALPSFLDQPDFASDFRDVFLRRRGVDCKYWHESSELLKFSVHQDRAHLKSSARIEVYHLGDAGC